MIGQRPPRNESHQHKTQDREPHGRAVLLGPLLCRGPPEGPFPLKSLAQSACVSPRTVHFQVSDKSHSWAWEGLPDAATDSLVSLSHVGSWGPADRNQEARADWAKALDAFPEGCVHHHPRGWPDVL